ETNAMCPVRVGQVSCSVHLMRPDLLEQCDGEANIFLTERFFTNGAGLVKRQIHKMQAFDGHATISSGGTGLAATDQSLDLLDFRTVYLTWFFVAQELFDVPLNFGCLLGPGACRHFKQPVVFRGKIRESDSVRIEHRDTATGLVGDMYFMPLVRQSNESTSHADDVVIGMRTEHQNALWKDLIVRAANITRALPVFRFTARPTRNRFGHCAKDVKIDVIRRTGTMTCEKILQAVFVVVFVGEF